MTRLKAISAKQISDWSGLFLCISFCIGSFLLLIQAFTNYGLFMTMISEALNVSIDRGTYGSLAALFLVAGVIVAGVFWVCLTQVMKKRAIVSLFLSISAGCLFSAFFPASFVILGSWNETDRWAENVVMFMILCSGLLYILMKRFKTIGASMNQPVAKAFQEWKRREIESGLQKATVEKERHD